MGKYPNRTCNECHIMRPANYMQQITVSEPSGHSGMGFSFNPSKKQSARISSGRSYHRLKKVWVCKDKEAHNNPTYYSDLEEKIEKQKYIARIRERVLEIMGMSDTDNLIYENFKQSIDCDKIKSP